MKDLIYRIAREALDNADLSADEIRQTVEAAIESYEQEAGA